MDTAKEIISLVFSLIGIALVLYLCYWVSRYTSKKMGTTSKFNKNMKVIERIALTQDKGMAIVEICSKYYLVSFSNNSVDILKELNSDEDKVILPDAYDNGLDFINVFQNMSKERKGNKKDV